MDPAGHVPRQDPYGSGWNNGGFLQQNNNSDIPTTFSRPLPTLTCAQVSERLKEAKKPNFIVPGDVSPSLYNRYNDILAVYNKITETKRWPEIWKLEHVTVIPKGPDPQEPAKCRNISCTNFLSKVYESFVLQWSREEVTPKLNQYMGGTQGLSNPPPNRSG